MHMRACLLGALYPTLGSTVRSRAEATKPSPPSRDTALRTTVGKTSSVYVVIPICGSVLSEDGFQLWSATSLSHPMMREIYDAWSAGAIQ